MLGLECELDSERMVLELVLASALILLDSLRDRVLLAGVTGSNSSSSSSSPTSRTVGTGYGEYVDGVRSVCSDEASSRTSSGTGGVEGCAELLGRVNRGTE
jgi:hypothetical protein